MKQSAQLTPDVKREIETRDLSMKIINRNRDFDLLKEVWSVLAKESNCHIFQTFEWNNTWWKYFGKDGSLNIVLFYHQEKLISIVPLFRDEVYVFGKKLYSCLRFIGSNITQPNGEPLIGLMAYTDYLDIVVLPDYKKQVAEKFADYIIKNSSQFDLILFEEVSEQSLFNTHIVPLLQKNGINMDVIDGSTCMGIKIEPGWENYLAKLDRNTRNNTRSYLKKLTVQENKLFDLYDLSHIDDVSDAADTIMNLHQLQWNSRGFPGAYYEKRMVDFTKEISREFFINGWLKIRKLTPADDKDTCIAADMYYFYKNRVYNIIGGMDYSYPLTRKGAGNALFTITLKEAIESGYQVFDYLRGEHEYKIRRADMVTTNRQIIIQNPEKEKTFWVTFIPALEKNKRRLRVEWIKFRLLFREHGFIDGIRTYFRYVSIRVLSLFKK